MNDKKIILFNDELIIKKKFVLDIIGCFENLIKVLKAEYGFAVDDNGASALVEDLKDLLKEQSVR